MPDKTVLMEPRRERKHGWGIGHGGTQARLHNKVIKVMPSSMSMERRMIVRALDAEVVLTGQAVDKAACESRRSLPHNWAGNLDRNGEVGRVVVEVGTGGTITGAGRYLKSNDLTLGSKLWQWSQGRAPSFQMRQTWTRHAT